MAKTNPLHHVELWVPDLARAERSWGWLLTRLGAEPYQSWEHGRSWRWGPDGTYVVVEQSPIVAVSTRSARPAGEQPGPLFQGVSSGDDARPTDLPQSLELFFGDAAAANEPHAQDVHVDDQSQAATEPTPTLPGS